MSNYYEINLPLFKLDENQKIEMPEGTDSIWFDVGLSFCAPNSVQFLRRNPKGFVVGFEADPKMYFGLFGLPHLANNLWLLDDDHPSASAELRKRRSNETLDDVFKHSTAEYLDVSDPLRRYIMIPCAVSDCRGTATLNFDPHHGSSTLQGTSKNSHKVSTVRLDEFISMVPDRFEYIDHLKVDAEGVDDKVVLSAGHLIDKFVVVSTELRFDGLMDKLGFDYLERQPGQYSYINRNKRRLLSKIDYKVRV